jgi:hypothetical protein
MTPSPALNPCLCKEATITDDNSYSYTDCSGLFVSGAGDSGLVICLDVNQSYTSNIQNEVNSILCSCL